jgi:y4mF family transcriptional regulator
VNIHLYPYREIFLLYGEKPRIIYRKGNYMTTITSAQQLGQAIRSTRKHLRLTQPQLALTAGVGVRFIVELEAGKPTVRLDAVMRVIASLGGVIHVEGLTSPEHENTRDAA